MLVDESDQKVVLTVVFNRDMKSDMPSREGTTTQVDNASVARNTGLEEMFQADEVNITKHDLILVTHQQTAVHGAVLLQQGFGTLLELLRADFFLHPFALNNQ